MAEPVSATAAAAGAAASLAKLPFEFGRRVRQGVRIPRDLNGLRRHVDWLSRSIEGCRVVLEQKRLQEEMASWNDQLLEAESVLDEVVPGHRKGVRDAHVQRDTEKLKQARELISAVQDELINTISIHELFPDPFKVHYWKPEPSKQTFYHRDDTDKDIGMVREGKLRELVLSTAGSERTAMYCAYGPGGMGKTVALKWICTDERIKEHFKHGVHWFSFGEDVEGGQLLTQIRCCALNCGSKQLANELAGEGSVQVALLKLSEIFVHQIVLFVIDDVWNAQGEELSLFRKTLNGGTGCAVVLSCREESIGNKCDENVPFSYLHPTGDISKEVLLSYLGEEKKEDVLVWVEEEEKCRVGLDNGLKECGGWVLCLAIAGAMLREEIRDCVDVDEATEVICSWAESVAKEADLTGEGTEEYPRGLEHIVGQSLKHAERNLRNQGFRNSSSSSVGEKFKRLCVMQKQKAMPVRVLSKAWNLGVRDTMRVVKAMTEMSLLEVNRVKKGSSEKEIRAHDKIIDLCREEAGNELVQRHAEFLDCFLGQSTRMHWHADVHYRPWWELPDESEYLMDHLGYYLQQANLLKELYGVLCDARFTMRWLKDGRGWIGVAENFDRVIRAGIRSNEGVEELRRALENVWSSISEDRHSLGFNMFGRLEKTQGKSVCQFLGSIERFESGPWLQPARPYFVPKDSRQQLCYDVGRLEAHSYPVWISKDFSTVALYKKCEDGLAMVDLKQQKVLPGTCRRVLCHPVFTHDGKVALSVNNKKRKGVIAHLYDLGKDELREYADPVTWLSACTAFAIHSVHKFALGFEDGSESITVVRNDGSLQHTPLAGHANWVGCVAFSADGSRVASGSYDKTVRVWRVSDGEELCSLSGHARLVRCVAFSADGSRVASGSSDRTLRVWRVSDGEELCSLSGHARSVECVAFSADGSRIASGSPDKTVRVWRVSDGKELCSLSGHADWVTCVAFSADGSRVASGSPDKTVRVWRVNDGEELWSLSGHANWVTCVAFSNDGSRVASGSEDETVRVWRVSDGEELCFLSGHARPVRCVAFSADGSRVASGSSDRTVRVWRVSDGEELCSLSGHARSVECVAFSADGSRVASGSRDKTVRIGVLKKTNL